MIELQYCNDRMEGPCACGVLLLFCPLFHSPWLKTSMYASQTLEAGRWMHEQS